MDYNQQLAADVHLATAPIRFVRNILGFFAFFVLMPVGLLGVFLYCLLNASFHLSENDYWFIKIAITLGGPVALMIWYTIIERITRQRRAEKLALRYINSGELSESSRYDFIEHTISTTTNRGTKWLILLASMAVSLMTSRFCYYDEDPTYVLHITLAVLSPVVLFYGWSLLKRICLAGIPEESY